MCGSVNANMASVLCGVWKGQVDPTLTNTLYAGWGVFDCAIYCTYQQPSASTFN